MKKYNNNNNNQFKFKTMKKVILSMAIASVMVVTGYSQSKDNHNHKHSSKKEVQAKTSNITFGVRGNCGMCKATIEKAVTSLDGVTKAVWDGDNKKIDISYDDTKTNLMELHTAIAKSGYDTDMSKADDKVYDNLAGCCQYDRNMKMSIKIKTKLNLKLSFYNSPFTSNKKDFIF